LIAALEPEDVVLGGGNVKQLETLPPGCRAGDNANAFIGGFRLWEKATAARTSSPATTPSKHLSDDTKGAPIWKQ
jgi:polyphosphate glucokinase